MNDIEKFNNQILVEQRPGDYEMQGGESEESDSGGMASLLNPIIRRWHILALTVLILCALGIPTIWLVVKPYYLVVGAIRVAPILTNILTGEADKGETGNFASFINTQAELATSTGVLQRAADDLANKNLEFFANKPIDVELRNAISDGIIKTETSRNSELIKIVMKSNTPSEAKQIVNSFMRAYLAIEGFSSTQGQDQQLMVLENEKKAHAEKMQSQRDTIYKLAQEYGTTTLDNRQNMMLQRVGSILSELTKIDARRAQLESQIQTLQKSDNNSIQYDSLAQMGQQYLNKDPLIENLTAQIVNAEQSLLFDKQRLTASNPELKNKQELIDKMKEQLEAQKKTASKKLLYICSAELEQTTIYQNRLKEMLSKEDSNTIELGRKQLAIQDLQDQLGLTKEMYDTISRRIKELEMDRKRPARISIAYEADIATIEDKRIKFTLAMFFGAIACGAMLSFLSYQIEPTVHTTNDVAKKIGIRIIGTTTSQDSIEAELLPRQIAEDYQTIRANISMFDNGQLPKIIAITSPCMQEGKTTFSVNMATSLAKSGKKVLLIDGDLRKPDIGHLLNVPQENRKLLDAVFGRSIDSAPYNIKDTNLYILSPDAVNFDAYELLSLPSIKQNINNIAQKFDHVIIDTPPILAFPDALIWGKMANGVILNSFSGKTSSKDLNDAKQKLTELKIRILGVVLSNVSTTQSYYRYGYNYYSQKERSKGKQHQNRLMLLMDGKDPQDNTNPPKI
jgi:succinoglycan biosynthesis transport protein ExoP